MMCNLQRLTLIACDDQRERDWNHYAETATRLVFLGGGTLLRCEILAALCEPTLDVERLIIDRAATAEQFLDVLAHLPSEFSGDVVRLDDRGAGFLSAAGRGGDRVLYALQPKDVRFYLGMHDLIVQRELEMIA
jgi:hypothetical protein